jgi:hypothetical protein
MLALGCSAAARSATAGAGALALEEVVLALEDALEAEEEVDDEEPQPAMSTAATGARRRAEGSLIGWMMTAPTG